jgi:hypothetical protein
MHSNYGIEELESYSVKEQRHITTLHQRLKKLRRTQAPTQRMQDAVEEEIQALEWIFELLDEISHD